ncbi:MAG: carbohydrate kinase family protein, partial [Spirochaetaceae bacterium]
LDADHERRTVTLLQAADPFTIDDIPAEEARIIHFAGLFAGDLPEELVERLAPRGEIALDAQGVVRKNEAGDLVSGDWKRKERFLPSITYFKTDAAEAEALTGLSDREKAAGRLVEMGAREVMLTYHSEVLLAAPGELHRAPLTPRNLSGRTGRGDTCFAAYLARRLSHDREESLRYAAALVSIKLETPGVFRGTPEDVIARIT